MRRQQPVRLLLIGKTAAVPVERRLCDHFTTIETLTPNSSAVSRHVRPNATDAATRPEDHSNKLGPSMPASNSRQHVESEQDPKGNPIPNSIQQKQTLRDSKPKLAKMQINPACFCQLVCGRMRAFTILVQL